MEVSVPLKSCDCCQNSWHSGFCISCTGTRGCPYPQTVPHDSVLMQSHPTTTSHSLTVIVLILIPLIHIFIFKDNCKLC